MSGRRKTLGRAISEGAAPSAPRNGKAAATERSPPTDGLFRSLHRLRRSRWSALSPTRLGCGAEAQACFLALVSAVFSHAQPAADWSSYLGDDARSHYSTLAQINTSNVRELTVAWTYRAGEVGQNQRSEMECNPLVVDGVIYATLPGATLIALDATTGRERWRFDPLAAAAARGDTRPKSELTTNRSRGVTYWTDGRERRLLHSAGHFLFAIDPDTGKPIASFGDRGCVDFNLGLNRDPTKMSLHSSTTPGTLFENLYVLSIRTNEGPGPSAPGHVRAFDVHTGNVVWTFHTIPHPGEYGYETWPPEAWKYAGGTNCWAGMAVDAERALLFAPTGSPTYDFWGGNRVGENLFGNSLICLDARTGKRKWHFQITRHDIWDRDLPAPPNLLTLRRDGKEIPAVAQVTKSGHVFVFHRETGEPLFPIEEIAAPSSDIPGEVAWPSQPLPTKPAPFSQQTISHADLTTRTPAVHRKALEQFARLKMAVPFQPPSREGTLIRPGLDGGAEWGGAAVDPNGIMYVNASDMAWLLPLVERKAVGAPAELGRNSYTLYCAGCHGLDRSGNASQNIPALTNLAARLSRADVLARTAEGRGAMPAFSFLPNAQRDELADFILDVVRPRTAKAAVAATKAGANDPSAVPSYHDVPFVRAGGGRWLDEDGYPNVKPPWGTLNAIDLNTGEYRWKVTLGEYPELIAQGVPPTGTDNYGGPVVTAGGLIFIAATRDEMIRAFDRSTGKTLWQARLPAAGYATPTTYSVNGRQYLVIACGGGKLGSKSDDAYVAFALPR
ncbi:MAG: pyrroloquinoline quinone-dependent dehydrogenase [Opitutus sp.]|nr:pyrroloquinoline quinone-dependent dehydrogenase [Opitutus sp.]